MYFNCDSAFDHSLKCSYDFNFEDHHGFRKSIPIDMPQLEDSYGRCDTRSSFCSMRSVKTPLPTIDFVQIDIDPTENEYEDLSAYLAHSSKPRNMDFPLCESPDFNSRHRENSCKTESNESKYATIKDTPDQHKIYERRLLQIFQKLKKHNEDKEIWEIQGCIEKILNLSPTIFKFEVSDVQLATFARDVRVRLTDIRNSAPHDYFGIVSEYNRLVDRTSSTSSFKRAFKKAKQFFKLSSSP